MKHWVFYIAISYNSFYLFFAIPISFRLSVRFPQIFGLQQNRAEPTIGVIPVFWEYDIANLVGSGCAVLNKKSSVPYLLFLSWFSSLVFFHSISSLLLLSASRLGLEKGCDDNKDVASLLSYQNQSFFHYLLLRYLYHQIDHQPDVLSYRAMDKKFKLCATYSWCNYYHKYYLCEVTQRQLHLMFLLLLSIFFQVEWPGF